MFGCCRIVSLCKTPIRKNAFRSMSTDGENLTFNNMFSDVNRIRVQKRLGSVKPARSPDPKKAKKPVRKAAVLVPLCTVDGVPSVLLTLRSSKLSNHKGEVSFPGGIHDASDRDLIHTAVREAEEELGLSPNHVDVWGKMLPVPGKNFKMMVTPVMAHIGAVDIGSLKYNTHEVAEVFSRSLESLCSPENVKFTRYRTGPGYTLPVFLGGDYRIWGLSAIILHMALTTLAPPPLYTFILRHR